MPVLDACCFKGSNKTGSIAIGVILLVCSIIFLGVVIGFVAGWEKVDSNFLLKVSDRIRDPCREPDYKGNCTNREWWAERVDSLQIKWDKLNEDVKTIWKNEFISLYCLIPWYCLANILLIIGAYKEIKILLLVWIAASLITLIWLFVLLAIIFSYTSTIEFVLTLALLQILCFFVLAYFMVVVFSFYQELVAKTLRSLVLLGSSGEEYINKSDQD
eukprot:TRINITY_DN8310_c0_g1_i1.p1 TRINITY_DN8310_c0_g1~~TRINITY_DN8310_c0_g1_i1.p1  ORF type:complete len:216 (+),score=48.68 TRINITY_DN8310_c0_g1_i1:62-709(+)